MNTLTVTHQGDSATLSSRAFNAPRSLVWRACTEPELVKRWLGVRAGWTLPICEIDPRVGGRYRYVWGKESKGFDLGMSGTYREIEAPDHLICTEQFDDPRVPRRVSGHRHVPGASRTHHTGSAPAIRYPGSPGWGAAFRDGSRGRGELRYTAELLPTLE